MHFLSTENEDLLQYVEQSWSSDPPTMSNEKQKEVSVNPLEIKIQQLIRKIEIVDKILVNLRF